jgi:ribosomal protein S18 acetylase RimI-like enzyme
MAPIPLGPPAGIVFRRLDSDLDRRQAARLLPDCGLDDHDGTCIWYGLCDLTATETTGLVGVAAVRSLEPATSRLCGLAMSPECRDGRLGRRLVREVADRLRATGAEEVTAPPVLDVRAGGLLRQVGFAPSAPSQRCGAGSLSLPL